MNERVRGILINNKKIILVKRIKDSGTYFCFPGGGVEKGESLEEALIREMKEELGVEVKVKELVMELPLVRPEIEQMEYFYLCEKVSGEIGTGTGPEFQPGNTYEGTHKIVQLPLKEIINLNLLPEEIKNLVLKIVN